MKRFIYILPIVCVLSFGCKTNATPYTVTFDGNGGVLKSGNEVQNVTSPTEIKAPTYEKSGYNQNGWDTDLSKVITTSTIKANWELTNYTITYDLGGGTNNPNNPTTYTINDEITFKAPTRNGYNFEGWTIDEDTPITKIEKGTTGDKVIKANWASVTYRVSYVLNGGTNNPDNPKSFTVNDEITLFDPTKERNNFLGWTDMGSGEKVTKIEKGTAKNITLIAHFEVSEYQVQFFDQVLAGSEEEGYRVDYEEITSYTKTVKPGEAVNKPKDPEPYDSKLGTFKGWYIDKQGNTPWNFDTKINKDVKLYAQYTTQKAYYVLFIFQFDETNYESYYALRETAFAKPVNDPSYIGYRFDGWYDSSDETQKIIHFPTYIDENYKSISLLYPKFTKMEGLTITYDTDGGSSIASEVVPYGALLTKPINPTKTSDLEFNYYFDKWQVNGVDYDFNKPVLTNMTLKATWTSKYWWNDEEYLESLMKIRKTGVIRGVKVNGLVHKVRLIGFKHDYIVDTSTGQKTDRKARMTWDFVNLICDKNGNSLSYLWTDTKTNGDYINSSVRYALTGNGANACRGSKILAGQKGQTTWSEEYNKTIISMFPADFIKRILTIHKTVGITVGSYKETAYQDKLFMLSMEEYGHHHDDQGPRGFGSVYSFYQNHPEDYCDIRIKSQINTSEIYETFTKIPKGSGQTYASVENNAGYCSKHHSKYGGNYWTRSPCLQDYIFAARDFVFTTYYDGSQGCMSNYQFALGISPAFCL